MEEWFSLLNGKNIDDFLNNNLENTEDNEFNNSIFKDFLNFFKEIDINEVDNIIIEIFE